MNEYLLSSDTISKACRICLDSDNPTDLIRPCLCKGGSEYVHRRCLDNWRALNKDDRGFKFCEVCQFEYIIEPVVDDPSADRKRLWLFRFLVTRDISAIILLIEALLIGLTFLLQAADKGSDDIRNLYPASMSSFGVYYLTSLILFFALLGLFGVIGACCGLASNGNTDRSNYTCISCFYFNSSCNNCNGSSDCNCNGGGGGDGAAAALIVIVLIFAILGVFVGIIMSAITIKEILKHHSRKLWLRQETKKYIVKDLQGRANEFRNRPIRHPIVGSSIRVETNNDRTGKTPSAPMELLSINTHNTE